MKNVKDWPMWAKVGVPVVFIAGAIGVLTEEPREPAPAAPETTVSSEPAPRVEKKEKPVKEEPKSDCIDVPSKIQERISLEPMMKIHFTPEKWAGFQGENIYYVAARVRSELGSDTLVFGTSDWESGGQIMALDNVTEIYSRFPKQDGLGQVEGTKTVRKCVK